MRVSLQITIVLLAILATLFYGCAAKKWTLPKDAIVASEFKGGKTLSIKLFKIACIPEYDVEPVDSIRRYLAEKLASSLRDLNIFGDILILGDNEKARTDIVFDGEFTAIDEGEPSSIIEGGIAGLFDWEGVIVDINDFEHSKAVTNTKSWALLAVKARIVKARDSSPIYEKDEIRMGRGQGMFYGRRCPTCDSADAIMRHLIDLAVAGIIQNLKNTLTGLSLPFVEYPLAGFWKDHCSHDYGYAIAPAGNGYYSITHCGPGGCSEPGMQPNSKIVDDGKYRVIDNDTIEFKMKSVSEYDEYARSIDKLGMTKEDTDKVLSGAKKLMMLGWLPYVRCPGR